MPLKISIYAFISVLILALVWMFAPPVFHFFHIPASAHIFQMFITGLIIFLWIVFGVEEAIKRLISTAKKWERKDLETKENIRMLRQSFKMAWRQIKKHQRRRWWGGRRIQPWAFLIGAPHSGKTSLLAHSDFPLVSPTQKPLQIPTPTRLVDWWFNDQIVFVDPAGKFALPEKSNGELLIFRRLLKLYKYRINVSSFHALIIIDAQTIMNADANQIENLVGRFTHQILSILKHYKSPTLSIVISQCDYLPGFIDFFSNLSEEERRECFGLALDDIKDHSKFPETLATKFSSLLNVISNRLFWRLHYEQNLLKRNHLKDLPFQFEKLSLRLQSFINQLPLGDNIQYQSIYFTSSQQPISSLSVTTMALRAFSQSQSKVQSEPFQKAFFIHELIGRFTAFVQKYRLRPTARSRFHFLAWLIATAGILGFAALAYQGYQDNKKVLSYIQSHFLLQAQTIPSTAEIPWLSQLNLLKKTSENLNQYDLSFYQWLGLGQGHELQTNIKQAYHQQLKDSFQPYLTQTLTTQIQENLNKNDHFALYNTLKTYLMLVTPSRFNLQEITQWFTQHWQMQFAQNPQTQQELHYYLSLLFKQKDLTWTKDNDLINQAQTNLRNMPVADLAYLQLESKYPTTEVPILPQYKDTNLLNFTVKTIKPFYSADNFNVIYNHDIPNAINKLKKGNWILGTKHGIPIGDEQKKILIDAVRKLYLQKYTTQWRTILSGISLDEPTSLTQAQEKIQLLSDPKSLLFQVLKFVFAQATIDNYLTKTPITEKDFVAINELLAEKGNFQQLKNILDSLSQYLKTISNSPNVLKASYDATVLRFQTKGDNDALTAIFAAAPNFPQPFASWLNSLGHGSWKVLLSNTRNYLNGIWTGLIYPDYSQFIAGRYPIVKDSKNDITLDHFTKFFGVDGSIENFFKTYLQNFVNIAGNYWTWSELNGERLQIPQETLEMFLRASIIQQMFFSENKTFPSSKFILTSLFLSSNVNAFVLNMNGQTMIIHPNEKLSQSFVWPRNDGNFVTIQFSVSESASPTITTSGPWAWYRLLDQSNLQHSSDPRSSTLTFQIGNYIASFQLTTENMVNPFIPGIVTKFSLPEKL